MKLLIITAIIMLTMLAISVLAENIGIGTILTVVSATVGNQGPLTAYVSVACNDISQCSGDTPICDNTGNCVPKSCGISASPIGFDVMTPGQTEGDIDQGQNPIFSIVTNNGNTATTQLDISGENWVGSNPSNGMDVGQTSWSIGNGWHAVTGGLVNTEGNVDSGDTLYVNFKLTVPINQPKDSYTQTITFTSSC
jgi:hypothetical protein